MSFRQAKWHEPVVFEMGRIHRQGFIFTTFEKEFKAEIGDTAELIPRESFRSEGPNLPSLSEVE
jgi:glycine dehydrogenase subunit 2